MGNFFCFRVGERDDFDLLFFLVKEDFLINLDGFLMLGEDFLINLDGFLMLEEDFLIDLDDLGDLMLFLVDVTGVSVFSAENDVV